MKQADPYYSSSHWRKLRARAIVLAGGTCSVDGCSTPNYRLTVDHIRTRPRGVRGPTSEDVLSNLRVLCHNHDVQIKESHTGKRFNDGELTVRGYDVSGNPIDPLHPWNR